MEPFKSTSAVMDLPVIGSIATMPTRAETFSVALKNILPQVDKLFVFLDGFDAIPDIIRDEPKCHITQLAAEEGLHASSRFLAPHLFGSEAVVVIFDDDILYPDNYVSTIKTALSKHGESSVVGFHAAIFLPPHNSYARDKINIGFLMRLDDQPIVHTLGCGTAAFLSSVFCPNPRHWKHHFMDDLYIAIEALKSGLSMIALTREANWLGALAENQPDSIWRSTQKNDRIQSFLMRYLLTQYIQSTNNRFLPPTTAS